MELTGIAAGFNDARAQALDRLRSEAAACGAHAVLDVRVLREHLDSRLQSVEYLITGTAVRFSGPRPPAKPYLVALPVDDYWKLMKAGYEPVGVAAATVVYQTRPSLAAARALAGRRYREGRQTLEVPEFSATVSDAVGLAMARLGASAQRWHASHVVGVEVERDLEAIDRDNLGRRPLAREPAKRKHLRVTVHVLGTAIREQKGETGFERTERGTWREVGNASRLRGAATEPVIGLGPVARPPTELEARRIRQK